jgi:hypothetical protein
MEQGVMNLRARNFTYICCVEYGAGVMNLRARQFTSVCCGEYGAGVMRSDSLLLFTVKIWSRSSESDD